jgi:TolA-binding protein
LREPAGLFPVDRGPRQRALDEFSWVLTAYPETRAAADALFHSGTVHLLGRDYREAVRLFRRFVERYPEHALAAEATYLVGYTCERHLGDRAAALAAYEQVIRRYPGSPRAMDAREALAR